MDTALETTDSRRVRFFKGTATEQAYRVIRQIVGTAVILALCMWVFIAWSWRSEYSMSRAAGRTQEFNLIAAFAGELTLTFDSACGALQLVQNEVGDMPPSASSGADGMQQDFPGVWFMRSPRACPVSMIEILFPERRRGLLLHELKDFFTRDHAAAARPFFVARRHVLDARRMLAG